MKKKHFSLSLLSALLLFGCGLQPAFTQQEPANQNKATLGVMLIDLSSKESRRFYCVPADAVEAQPAINKVNPK